MCLGMIIFNFLLFYIRKISAKTYESQYMKFLDYESDATNKTTTGIGIKCFWFNTETFAVFDLSEFKGTLKNEK